MSNCGVLQNAIRDFLWTVSIMYNAIYKCVFQRGKITSLLIAALQEVCLNFRASQGGYVTLAHTLFPQQPRGLVQIQCLEPRRQQVITARLST